MQPGDVVFDDSWRYQAVQQSPASIQSSIRALLRDLKEFHSIDLKSTESPVNKTIRLSVRKEAVKTNASPEIEKQAYLLEISQTQIEITGNSDAGVFYGVQTLLQLLKPGLRGNWTLPVCTIADWPTYQLRFLHWDTKHHQDRTETLKRYLDWSARFKVNMIGFELEDKFAYPSHPVIGAPGAFTTEQLQEIVNYGLERHIQVVPQIQSPAHMAYVLKHPEFADLRADGNNYQADLCDPRTYQLIFSMYDDAIKATRGVDYLFVSTDEVYYAGIGGKCDKPYNPVNRSLAWVEFVRRAHEFLAQRGRKMLAWVEYPFLTDHVNLLPPDLINGVLGDENDKIEAETKRGIRQLIYTSMQGDELLFPNHLKNTPSTSPGRLISAFETISSAPQQANPIGVYGAAWDDSGLHNEIFWLGWATVAQYGWSPGVPSVEQTVSDFMNIYYGPRVFDMVEVYRGLQIQAHFFETSWDKVVSKVRAPGYGNSEGKGIGTARYDKSLPQPAMPALPDLAFIPVYVGRYAKLVEEASQKAQENDTLVHRIHQNILRTDRNAYNLEVFLSLAELARHHSQLLLGLKRIEDLFQAARHELENNKNEQAMTELVSAYHQARDIVQDRHRTFEYVKAIWEKSRYPKGRELEGKKFYHVFDDVKDHWADRRADLSYMVAPEEGIGLESWMKRLASLIREYAGQHGLPMPSLEK
ncbi:MAG TPA: glycoside hydrolase family 20 zincin-like fold domain-containing protein [Acidobacteriota bacterium]